MEKKVVVRQGKITHGFNSLMQPPDGIIRAPLRKTEIVQKKTNKCRLFRQKKLVRKSNSFKLENGLQRQQHEKYSRDSILKDQHGNLPVEMHLEMVWCIPVHVNLGPGKSMYQSYLLPPQVL